MRRVRSGPLAPVGNGLVRPLYLLRRLRDLDRGDGTAEHPFESDVRSAQERLANGNTLFTESDSGRLFAVTPAGEIVWEFVNPTRFERDGQTLNPIVQSAERVEAPWLFQHVATNNRHP